MNSSLDGGVISVVSSCSRGAFTLGDTTEDFPEPVELPYLVSSSLRPNVDVVVAGLGTVVASSRRSFTTVTNFCDGTFA